LFTETLPVCAIAVALPAASVNDPDVTVTTAVPPTDVAAVNVAVYTVLLVVWKLLSVPKVALMSANEKFDVASLAVNVTVAVPPELTDDGLATTVIVGTTPSITIALAPAMLLVPLGTVVEVIALPAVSSTVPTVKLETVRSEDDCPDVTVYVPVSEVPADAAVNVTVVPVLSVTVRVFPDPIASLVVAEMFTVPPIAYVPSAVDEEKAVTVGKTPSITIAFASAMLLVPLGTVVEVIALPAVSRIVPIVKLETVKSEEACPDATVYVPESDVPAEAAVSVTVAPVSSVTVRVFPD
jgi:hypothetical protein